MSFRLISAACEEHHDQGKDVGEHQHKLIRNIDAKGLQIKLKRICKTIEKASQKCAYRVVFSQYDNREGRVSFFCGDSLHKAACCGNGQIGPCDSRNRTCDQNIGEAIAAHPQAERIGCIGIFSHRSALQAQRSAAVKEPASDHQQIGQIDQNVLLKENRSNDRDFMEHWKCNILERVHRREFHGYTKNTSVKKLVTPVASSTIAVPTRAGLLPRYTTIYP